ncbi:MAG: porin [Phycisphaerales bacterium]
MNTKALFVLAGSVLSVAGPAMASSDAVSRDEVRAIVAEMMNDAQNRTSLLQGGGSAGHDNKGFFMASGDGNFRLNVGGFTQFTYYHNFRDSVTPSAIPPVVVNNEYEPGFQVKRARLEFKGHVITPDLTFAVTEELSNNAAGTASLKDAWFDYSFGNGWYVKGGQFKLNFLREENISVTYQLSSERSIVNAVFTQDRSQGLEFGYRDEQFRANIALSDGVNSDNTPFAFPGGANADLSPLPETDFALTFRAEWNFMGSLDTLKDFTSKSDGEWAAMIGAGVHYQQSSNDEGGTGGTFSGYIDENYLSYTVDFQIEGAGFSGYIGFVGTDIEGRPAVNGGSEEDSAQDYGLVAQISYRWDDFEPFFRYEGLYLDDDLESGRGFATTPDTDNNLNFLTFGFNYYFAGHAAKFTLDAVVALEANNFTIGGAVAPPGVIGLPIGNQNSGGNVLSGGSNTIGLLPDSNDGQVVVRFQFQLMF